MNPSDMSPERDAYSTRILTLTCMSDFIGIRRLWMSAVFEGIADGHDLRSPSKRVMNACTMFDLMRTPFLWCESTGILACMSINASPHYIVGVSREAKMESSQVNNIPKSS